jgi:hypothetical protein
MPARRGRSRTCWRAVASGPAGTRHWRRGWDSNPRRFPSAVFKTAAFGRSATSPRSERAGKCLDLPSPVGYRERIDLVSGAFQAIPLVRLQSLSITLSPLAGRVELAHGAVADAERLAFSYPATTSAAATVLVRMLRRAWADRASIGVPGGVSAQEGRPAA